MWRKCHACVTNSTPSREVARTRDTTCDMFRAALVAAAALLLPAGPAQAAPPALRAGDAQATEGGRAIFVVKLSRRADRRVRVRFTTLAESASSGVDFVSRSGRLVFRPGQRVKRIAVPLTQDALDEVDEVFVLRLSHRVNARIRDRFGRGTILDDDPAPAPPPPPAPAAPVPPQPGDLVLNEIHADPHLTRGDANGDGVVSSDGDEFVELVNVTDEPLALGGVTISDALAVRYTFPDAEVLAPGCAVVVFGGLVLNNGGDTVSIALGETVLTSVTYGPEGGQDQSLTRAPDLSGDFVQHLTANSAARFSPGRKSDAGSFC
jgi:Calx-beta domain-containing protein/lamin tail-like protein